MSPITHLLAGWAVANAARLERRDRMLVTLAGVIPDADGLGVVIDLIRRNAAAPHEFYQKFHHVLFHNLFFGIALAAAAYFFAMRRRMTAALVFLSFHIHLLGDLSGSRGGEEDFWAFPYLSPLSNYEVVWRGQWPLNGWQNFVITGALMALMFFLAWKRGYSPLEMISLKADEGFVGILRKRFGEPDKRSVSAA